MKEIVKISLLLLLVPCFSAFGQSNRELSVMSFNIRMSTTQDKANWWKNRVKAVTPFLQEQLPDVMGAQEVLHCQLTDIKKMLPKYKYIGVGREDGKRKGEYAPLFYNPERLTLLESGWFWLSETPDKPSKGWDAACERIATWGIFQLNGSTSGEKVAIINTHFDHVGSVARANSSRMLREWVASKSSLMPVIVTGDFNAIPQTSVIVSLKKDLTDSFDTAEARSGGEGTFHDYGSYTPEGCPRIDYILYTGGMKPLVYTAFDQPVRADKNFWLSDHAPILVKFSIGD